MHIQLAAVGSHVVAAFVQEHSLVEDSYFGRLEVGDEDLRAGKGGVGCPFRGICEGEQLCPVRKRRQDFECFWQWTGLIAGEEEADSDCQLEFLVEGTADLVYTSTTFGLSPFLGSGGPSSRVSVVAGECITHHPRPVLWRRRHPPSWKR